MKITIGIDLGGTCIKAVAINEEGTILERLQLPTNDGNDKAWKQKVSDIVKKLQSQFQTKNPVGISAPGLPNSDNSAIDFMPGRMQGIENFIWNDFLRLPVYVLNDAVAALIAEAKFGSAKGKQNVVMLTLGTGVGGAILIEGKPYFGMYNKAGHIGHMIINDDDDPDITGMPGSLENCIGNCTIQKRTDGKFNSTNELLEAMKNGDEFARKVWLKSVRHLALGIASITNILSPEIVVIGGGVSQADKELFEPLVKYMDDFEWRAGGYAVTVVKAFHGEMAGAIGAAGFAMTKNI